MSLAADLRGDVRVTGTLYVTGFTPPPSSIGAAALSLNLKTGYIKLHLTTVRLISANDIQATTEGGIPDNNTTPSLLRVNTGTDKCLRLTWAAGNVTEVQFEPVPLPPDLDETQPVEIHLLVDKNTNTDVSANIALGAYFNVGDTNCGGNTAAITELTPTEKSVLLAAVDVPGPPGVLNVTLTPGTHATDAIRLYSAWIEYSRAS